MGHVFVTSLAGFIEGGSEIGEHLFRFGGSARVSVVDRLVGVVTVTFLDVEVGCLAFLG